MVSLLAVDEGIRAGALGRLARRLGPAVLYSEPMAFGPSRYYDDEMGSPVTRRVAAFGPLVPPDRLAWAKRVCLSLEHDFAVEGRRRVNLDPGCLSAGALVLATVKPSDCRPALGGGIYADVQLRFERGRYRPLPWTYPDYAGEELAGLLELMRERYLWDLKHAGRAPGARGRETNH